MMSFHPPTSHQADHVGFPFLFTFRQLWPMSLMAIFGDQWWSVMGDFVAFFGSMNTRNQIYSFNKASIMELVFNSDPAIYFCHFSHLVSNQKIYFDMLPHAQPSMIVRNFVEYEPKGPKLVANPYNTLKNY
jgi:hypothetical protein